MAQESEFDFISAIFSHTGQIHGAVMELMRSQIQHKLELDDPEVQSGTVVKFRACLICGSNNYLVLLTERFVGIL